MEALRIKPRQSGLKVFLLNHCPLLSCSRVDQEMSYPSWVRGDFLPGANTRCMEKASTGGSKGELPVAELASRVFCQTLARAQETLECSGADSALSERRISCFQRGILRMPLCTRLFTVSTSTFLGKFVTSCLPQWG